MKLIERTIWDNGEIVYAHNAQKLGEVKEKLYRYERVADEPEKVVAIDRVLEIIDAQVCCGRLSANDFREAVLALKVE